VLVSHIEDNITARDIAMVEQSDHFLAFRPLYNAVPSGGVRTEMKCFMRRFDYRRGDKSRMFVYSCPQFADDLPGLSRAVLRDVKALRALFRVPQDKSEAAILTKLDANSILDFARMQDGLDIVGRFESVLKPAGIEIVRTKTPTVLKSKDPNAELRSAVSEMREELAWLIGVSREPHTVCIDVPPWTLQTEDAARKEAIHNICDKLTTVISQKTAQTEA
jgi:hypothetical protein